MFFGLLRGARSSAVFFLVGGDAGCFWRSYLYIYTYIPDIFVKKMLKSTDILWHNIQVNFNEAKGFKYWRCFTLNYCLMSSRRSWWSFVTGILEECNMTSTWYIGFEIKGHVSLLGWIVNIPIGRPTTQNSTVQSLGIWSGATVGGDAFIVLDEGGGVAVAFGQGLGRDSPVDALEMLGADGKRRNLCNRSLAALSSDKQWEEDGTMDFLR